MGFKRTTRSLDFADLALATCLEQNRSIKHMQQLSNCINWSRVESILLSHYTVGTSDEGACAYLPLMLFKGLMLQKWFRIPSDLELENHINDRLSFKTFLGLAFSQPAPDHSTFSRFRSRLPKAAMDQINSEILRQFESQGLCINESVAVDARLVKSASRPLSQDELKKQREHRQTEEGRRDKNCKALKFSRDLESDWAIRHDTPHFGLKEHAAVATRYGFVLATTLTPASVHNTNYLAYCTAFSRHTKQKIKKVYAELRHQPLARPGRTDSVYHPHQEQVRHLVPAGGLQHGKANENPLSGFGVSRGLFLKPPSGWQPEPEKPPLRGLEKQIGLKCPR